MSKPIADTFNEGDGGSAGLDPGVYPNGMADRVAEIKADVEANRIMSENAGIIEASPHASDEIKKLVREAAGGLGRLEGKEVHELGGDIFNLLRDTSGNYRTKYRDALTGAEVESIAARRIAPRNRLGRLVLPDFLLDDYTLLRAIYREIVPIRIEHRLDMQAMEVVAYSDQFDPVGVGYLRPEYIGIFTYTDGVPSVTFKRKE